jgi:outer membrane protein assembly factor BamD (BamD/ComL family)
MEKTTIVFSERDGVATFQAIALKHGLALYAKAHIKPNSAWTPTRMLKLATSFTKVPYKRGRYKQAIADLEVWINAYGTTRSSTDVQS